MEKLEWCDYPMVKKNFEDIFIRFDAIHECDRQTDGRTDRHRVTAYAALMHSIARQISRFSTIFGYRYSQILQ